MSAANVPLIHRFEKMDGLFRWPTVSLREYNAVGNQSKGMTKQVVFEANQQLPAELRYFESAPGGHSALERHDHVHTVVILRGEGSVLLGDTIYPIAAHDTIYIPSWTWHQFYADKDQPLGFLCLVAGDRDRPSRPTEEEVNELRNNPAIREWVRA